MSKNVSLGPTSTIAEIGCGYGGQAAVLNRMFAVKDYTCFDLDPALRLIDIYLHRINSGLVVKHGSLDQEERNWDFAISNYAFSELSRDLQLEYLNKVISRSQAGYMIMNSGRTNKTGRSLGKLHYKEIFEFLPNPRIEEEEPLTGPDNYVILWGVDQSTVGKSGLSQ